MMKKSAFIFLFLLTALSAALSSETKAAASGARRAVTSVSISTQCSDYVAAEALQLSVPAPSRALRKSNERLLRVTHEMPILPCERYFSAVQRSYAQSIASLLLDAHTASPSHSADYLKFGILVI